MSKSIILAYSGGLDTSVMLHWLKQRGFDVICFYGNVGQQENFHAVYEKAKKTGAKKVYIEDLRSTFITEYIFPALSANAVYEGRYLMGTALARPILAKRQIEIAQMEKAGFVAHGATGKGNDQVRFELGYYALNPDITCISPWRMPEFIEAFKGRCDLMDYANAHGIPISSTPDKPYSEDENLFHVSHEAGMLENPSIKAPEEVYSMTLSPQMAPEKETIIDIHFEKGIPVKLVHKAASVIETDPLSLFLYLNAIGGQNAIGRLDIVENRLNGIKSRGIYETPGGSILWCAHRDLETITMDKEVMHLRDSLSQKFSEMVYNGLWFSPELQFLLAVFKKSQESVTGCVRIALYKGNISIIGRSAPTSLYDASLSSMDHLEKFNPEDATGFIKTVAIRLKAHNKVTQQDSN